MRIIAVATLFGLILACCPRDACGQIDAEQVRQSIERGVRYLRNQQDFRSGRWSEYEGAPGGVTALCTLALLNAGVPADDPAIQQALAFLRRPDEDRRTYSVSLETMVLCAAEPERDRFQIRENVAWLQRNQRQSPPFSGAWGYGEETGGADPSNTQFAMLALYEAERVGIAVQDVVWRRALGYWTRNQRSDGSWAYRDEYPSTGSMTCAGIASTIIAMGQVNDGDARLQDGQVLCCQPQSDPEVPQRGLEWLARNFTVSSNPINRSLRSQTYSQAYVLYYLYALERVGRMTANRFIGQHDWYREGAEVLVRTQKVGTGEWTGRGGEQNPEIATALALLFLSKGRRPVVAAKLQTSDGSDWNRHRSDLAHLTAYVEQRWQKDLTWQVIHSQAATLEDLMQTPVIYISGRDRLSLAPEQKQLLKQYVEQGGFIFAESCCDGEGFDQAFRDLMTELFPDSELRLLPPDHPIWYAEQKVAPEYVRPLYGLDSCCRTSVVYCPGELSCYWELGSPRRFDGLPDAVRDEVAATLAIGANVLTYATNRELKEKLDAPEIVLDNVSTEPNQRSTLYVAKLQHAGGSDDAPAALSNLLRVASSQLQLRISPEKHLLSPAAETLRDYPIAFLHGRRAFRFSPAERAALAQYIERGGFVFADSICASGAFTESFRREMKACFPDHALRPIPADHPLFGREFQGDDLARVRLRNPRRQSSDDGGVVNRIEETAPMLEGIEIDGKYVVVFSPYDISCALENQASIECHGYVREDAMRIGINILLYAMQQ